jgi:hypothetical protein
VIGVKKYGWNKTRSALLERYFDEPSMVLEIKDDKALVFFEQEGPTWYNLTKLERVYVTEEFTDNDRRDLASDKLYRSDQSRNEDDR